MTHAPPRIRLLVATCGALTGAVVFTPQAWAGGETPYPLSNEAAVTGAVLASGTEIGSMFYNPAALAGTRRAETEVSGEAIGGRWIHARRGAVLPTAEGPATRSLKSSETLVVSTTFATAFALTPKWSLGIGVFSPVSMDAEFKVEDDRSSYTARRNAQRFLFGPALGWQPHPDVRLGVSLMGVYDQLRSQHRLYAGLGEGQALSLDRESTSDAFGLTATLGTSVRVHRLAWVGATVQIPTFILDHEQGGSTLVAQVGQAGQGGTSLDFEPVTDGEVNGPALTGWRAALGGSVGTPRWNVAADFYARAPVPERTEQLGWGARVGGRGSIGTRFGLGGGLFTDQQTRSDAGRLALRGDRYGAMLGFEYRQPVRLAKGEAARTIEFLTIVSVRYAYETGTIGGVAANPELPSGFEFNRTPATSHMALVHIGSSLAF